MDISKLDPTLQGVIIGSVLSLAGNFLLQLIAFIVEGFQWTRKRKAEKEDLETQRRKSEIERVRNIYANCISRLSLLSSYFADEQKLSKEELAKMRSESFEWISLLKLHRQDLYSDESSGFHKEIENYTRAPESYSSSLLFEINKIFITDKLLFPEAKPFAENLFVGKTIQLNISNTYRREQIVKGLELPQQYTFQCELSTLSEKQREILCDIYFGHYHAIPDNFLLVMPGFDKDHKKIEFNGEAWEGKINPLILSPDQILALWERDYLVALDTAKKMLGNSQDSGTTPK